MSLFISTVSCASSAKCLKTLVDDNHGSFDQINEKLLQMSQGLKREEAKGTGPGAIPKPPPSPWESPSVFPRDVHDKIVEIHQKINTMPLPLPVPDWPETSTSKTEVLDLSNDR